MWVCGNIVTTADFTPHTISLCDGLCMARILIIEDEHDVADLIATQLGAAGLQVILAFDGLTGIEAARRESMDLIVLDLNLPDRDGFSVFSDLRNDPGTDGIPVLMLSARATLGDRIRGLDMGADDYITKPFSPKELLLRIRAILRRSTNPTPSCEFIHGPFRFDRNNFKVFVDDAQIRLTVTEYRLLLYLCERHGQTVDRRDLHQALWESNELIHSRALDTNVTRLRQKLGSYGAWLETVRRLGYCISTSEPISNDDGTHPCGNVSDGRFDDASHPASM